MIFILKEFRGKEIRLSAITTINISFNHSSVIVSFIRLMQYTIHILIDFFNLKNYAKIYVIFNILI